MSEEGSCQPGVHLIPGLHLQCFGVQMNLLDGKYRDEASRVLGKVDTAGCGCIQTKLKRSVIVSVGKSLAFLGF